MDSIKLLTVILAVVLGIMFMLLLVLAFIYLNSKIAVLTYTFNFQCGNIPRGL